MRRIYQDDQPGKRVCSQSITVVPPIGSWVLLLLLLSSAHAGFDQNGTEPAPQETETITLTVTVTNGRDELITGLGQSDFSLLADKVPQNISSFSDEDTPASIGILFDRSGSMDTRRGLAVIKAYKDALREFFARSQRTNDYFLIGFGIKPHLLVDWTSDGEAILNELNSVQFKGNTAFFDACYAGIEKVARGKNQKRAIILVSDGQDNSSTHGRDEVRRLLRNYNVLVYSVNIFSDDGDVGSPLSDEGQTILNDLSRVSGGMTFYRNPTHRVTLGDLNSILRLIADELHYQYSIGFVPSNKAAKDQWQRIKVKVTADKKDIRLRGLTVRCREGYQVANH